VPGVPQLGKPIVTHALVTSSQQPPTPAQALGSHWQAPRVQTCPAVHAAPAPQSQAPVAASQLSETVGSQTRHAVPLSDPQSGKPLVWQPPLLSQQPMGHAMLLHPPHAPLTHVFPGPQAGPPPQLQLPLLSH
jgi:hypothetical protein